MKNMGYLSAAAEYEKGLHYTDFTIANMAPVYLDDPYNIDENGKKVQYQEGTLHQVEFNGKNYSSMHDIADNLLFGEAVNQKISEKLDVYSIPTSESGAGVGKKNPGVSYRTEVYKVIFGQSALDELLKVSAVHVHEDVDFSRFVDQYNFITAKVPSVALMAQSGLSYQRQNGVNCQRLLLIKNVFAEVPEEVRYITSRRHLEELDITRNNTWRDKFAQNCQEYGLTLAYFDKSFKPHNTGYPHLRFRPDIATRSKKSKPTFEDRTADSNTVDLVAAKVALNLGTSRNMITNNIPVEIATNDFSYGFSQSRILLPNIETLREYIRDAEQNGLQNPSIRDYLNELVQFAKLGLTPSEHIYLLPFEEMLGLGKNVSTSAIESLGTVQVYTARHSAKFNEYTWKRQQKGIEFLQGVRYV